MATDQPRHLCRRCKESIRAADLKDGHCPDCIAEMTADDPFPYGTTTEAVEFGDDYEPRREDE